jgi:thiol-disulfide isomerase/thioredoxin
MARREAKMHLKRLTAGAALLSCAMLAACGDNQSTNMSAGSTPVVVSAPRNTAFPMPPLSTAAELNRNPYGWTLPDNSHRRLANYTGQVVVLDFYATWCPPCREEVPHLNKLQKQYGARGLHVVGLNVGGPDDRDKVPDFVREFGITYALGFPDQQMIDLYLSDDDRIPQTYVFDREGQLVKRFVSYGANMPAELERAVQTALTSQNNQATIKPDSGDASAVIAVSH